MLTDTTGIPERCSGSINRYTLYILSVIVVIVVLFVATELYFTQSSNEEVVVKSVLRRSLTVSTISIDGAEYIVVQDSQGIAITPKK